MDQSLSITPPPELVQQWFADWESSDNEEVSFAEFAVPRAAQWGADMELEACIDVLSGQYEWDQLSQCIGWKQFRDLSENILRAARRPKQPSLKEQAMEALREAESSGCLYVNGRSDIIRHALEQLDD